MTDLSIRLYMIPGSGTDKRMYAPQLEALNGMVVTEWLAPLHLKEPLESYARRLSKTIDTSQPFALGGTSLGGMLAQEMALYLNPVALILISTASTSQALPLFFRIGGKLTRAMPDMAVKLWFRLLAWLVTLTNLRRKAIYASMLRAMPPRLVRWQSGAATEWELKGKPGMPVFHIHGAKDRIIPLKNIRAQKTVADGGHLINVTHEREVNDFISESLRKMTASQLYNIQAIQ